MYYTYISEFSSLGQFKLQYYIGQEFKCIFNINVDLFNESKDSNFQLTNIFITQQLTSK